MVVLLAGVGRGREETRDESSENKSMFSPEGSRSSDASVLKGCSFEVEVAMLRGYGRRGGGRG